MVVVFQQFEMMLPGIKKCELLSLHVHATRNMGIIFMAKKSQLSSSVELPIENLYYPDI